MKDSLHEHAVQAEAHLEKLATGLAQSGADEGTVAVVSKMADVTRKIVKALGKGQESTGDAEPAAQEQPPPDQGAPPQQGPPPAGPPQRETYDSATAALHNQVRAKAAGGK